MFLPFPFNSFRGKIYPPSVLPSPCGFFLAPLCLFPFSHCVPGLLAIIPFPEDAQQWYSHHMHLLPQYICSPIPTSAHLLPHLSFNVTSSETAPFIPECSCYYCLWTPPPFFLLEHLPQLAIQTRMGIAYYLPSPETWKLCEGK